MSQSGGQDRAAVAIAPPARRPAGGIGAQFIRFLRVYVRSIPAAVSLAVIVAVVLLALLAPAIMPYDPVKTNLLQRLTPPVGVEDGSWSHALGTDHLGRDVLTRSVYGARVSLIIAVPSTVISVVLGVAVGLLAGYKRGRIDTVLMRLVDAKRALPILVVGIAVMAFVGGGVWTLTVFLGIWNLSQYARLVRGDTLTVVNREYVTAAIALGVSPLRVVMRHILPNILTPVIVLASFLLPHVIITEASLSFLGLGVPRPTPSWGNMMAESRELMERAWWTLLGPGLFMVVTVLAINFAGDRLREVWDPHLRGRQKLRRVD